MYSNPPTWHLYPVDIPADHRLRCGVSDCDEPGELVEVRANLRPSIAAEVDPSTRVYCLPHARRCGYEQPSRVLPPEHLNLFQRLIAHLVQ
jgi:hypothetical protein